MDERPLLTLLIEDDPGDAFLVERMLGLCRQRFNLRHCDCLEKAQALLDSAESEVDVCLLDLSLPDSIGLSALEALRNSAPDVPVVVLTGLADDELALQALDQGAQDYLVKSNATAEMLERALRHAVQRQQIQTENRRLLTRMEELALRDPLTGVLNRHSFAEHVEREWRMAERRRRPLACVVLDIDFFKRVNDTYGHAAGDRALQDVAGTLRRTCRETDLVGRLGGEEFGVLLPNTNEAGAVGWAEIARREIAGLVISLERDAFQVTASLGVASRRHDSRKPLALLDEADEAMFVAKQLGRDQVVGFARLRGLDWNVSSQRWGGLSVGELMSPLGGFVPATETIAAAMRIMVAGSIDCLTVLAADGQLVGIIGQNDILVAALTMRSWERPVSEVMQTRLVTYDAAVPAREVCEFLCRAAVRQVFVVDAGGPRGVVTRANILRWLETPCENGETCAAGTEPLPLFAAPNRSAH